ncbi:hypothetical protein [Micromonospora sp. NPDC093277]|uniref:hypothetical protein n=1 Tax=Micromonospora sp. NPDC093277 TaxID=3364291 RepID=UPI00380B6093
MKFYELMALIWVFAGLAIALTWIVLRHRRGQARMAVQTRSRAELEAQSTQLADLQTRVDRMEKQPRSSD